MSFPNRFTSLGIFSYTRIHLRHNQYLRCIIQYFYQYVHMHTFFGGILWNGVPLISELCHHWWHNIEVSETKWVNPNVILYVVNSLKLEGLHITCHAVHRLSGIAYCFLPVQDMTTFLPLIRYTIFCPQVVFVWFLSVYDSYVVTKPLKCVINRSLYWICVFYWYR